MPEPVTLTDSFHESITVQGDYIQKVEIRVNKDGNGMLNIFTPENLFMVRDVPGPALSIIANYKCCNKSFVIVVERSTYIFSNLIA